MGNPRLPDGMRHDDVEATIGMFSQILAHLDSEIDRWTGIADEHRRDFRSAKRQLRSFEEQRTAARNLLDQAHELLTYVPRDHEDGTPVEGEEGDLDL